jgi:hypothetical protein
MRHPRILTEPEIYRLPQPIAPQPAPGAFILCPVAASFPHFLNQQLLYRLALEQALAVARPSLPERDLVGVWN